MAAIDDAVADGVDVINYSVGDTVDDVGAVEVGDRQLDVMEAREHRPAFR
ncbi:hypothetical protein GCM10009557_89560 [Virgisporangium ochraceum]